MQRNTSENQADLLVKPPRPQNAEKPDLLAPLMDLAEHKICPMENLLATMRTPDWSLNQKLVYESKDILIMKSGN